MIPDNIRNFKKEQPPNPIDKAINAAALILAEKRILGEPKKQKNSFAINGREDQEMHFEANSNRQREENQIKITAEAKKMEPGLRNLVVLMDTKDKENKRKETGFVNMILAADNPAEALVQAYEIERKEMFEKMDRKEKAA